MHVTGISSCRLVDMSNISTSTCTRSLFASIVVATFERAVRYTTTHATSVANSSSLDVPSQVIRKGHCRKISDNLNNYLILRGMSLLLMIINRYYITITSTKKNKCHTLVRKYSKQMAFQLKCALHNTA